MFLIKITDFSSVSKLVDQQVKKGREIICIAAEYIQDFSRSFLHLKKLTSTA